MIMHDSRLHNLRLIRSQKINVCACSRLGINARCKHFSDERSDCILFGHCQPVTSITFVPIGLINR